MYVKYVFSMYLFLLYVLLEYMSKEHYLIVFLLIVYYYYLSLTFDNKSYESTKTNILVSYPANNYCLCSHSLI